MLPAARLTDMHVCPMVTGVVPHIGGPIMGPGAPMVLIGGLPAARATDMCVCAGPPDVILMGAPTVLIGGLPAARMGDPTAHGGAIVAGCPTVLIRVSGGSVASGAPGSALAAAVAGSNPTGSVINCGNIIDAVVARLDGSDPNATATAEGDGTFNEIEQRLGTSLEWGQSLDEAYSQVQARGPGTMAVVGIAYSGGTASHVVIIANDRGTVGIVEGQDWGPGQGAGVIRDPAAANARYNSDGGSDIGIGIIPPRG